MKQAVSYGERARNSAIVIRVEEQAAVMSIELREIGSPAFFGISDVDGFGSLLFM